MNHSNLSETDKQLLEGQAKEYLEEAKRLKQQNKFQLSVEAAEQAVTLHQQLEMWEGCVEARVFIGGILYTIGKQSLEILTYLEETLQLANKYLEKKHALFAAIFYHLGHEYERKKHVEIGGEYYYKALEIRKMTNGEGSFQVGFLYGYIGRNLYGQNDSDGSIAAFEKGLAILENAKGKFEDQIEIERSKARIYSLYGRRLLRSGNPKKVLFYLNRALDISLKIGESEKVHIGEIYMNIGYVYSDMGEYNTSLLFHKKALHIWQLLLGNAHRFVVEIKIDISIVLISMKADDEAIPYLKEVIDIFENSLEVDNKLGNAYTQFSRIYARKQNYDQAFIYIEKALQTNTKLYGENSPYVSDNEFVIGEFYRHKGEYEKALKYYRQSLNKSLVLGKMQEDTVYYNHFGIGSALANQNKDLLALHSFQKCLQVLCSNFRESDIYQNPKLQNIPAVINVTTILIVRAYSFFNHYQRVTQAIRDYEAALANYQLVDELIDRFRQNYESTQSKLFLASENVLKNYSKGIYTALNAPSSMDKRAFAFRFSEKAKATVLYTSLQESIAKAEANISEELLQKEKNLKVELTTLDKHIQQQVAMGKRQEDKQFQKLQNEFFDLHQAYIQLIEGFEENYPDYYQLKYQTETVSIEEIQARLADNQWMVSYFIGEKHYYIFLIGKEEFEVLDLEKINGFEQLVEDFLSAIQNHKLEEYTQKGYKLYQELLQPLEMYLIDPSMDEKDSIQQLIVIPHGILHYLPFEALICTRSKSSGKVYVANEKEENTTSLYQSLDYALLHFEVSYHYSATLWYYMLSKQGERAPTDANSFVGFAPVYQSKNHLALESLDSAAKQVGNWANRSEALRSDGTWTPLPYSKLEVEEVANLFTQKGLSAQAFLHEEATKQQFREVVAKSRFLLIAAHGVANDEQPKLSGLVFFPTVDGRRQTVDGAGISNTEHPISNSESPISNNESRTTNNQSPITNNQSPITNNQHDCILSMEETYHLDLKADLVVLSSCESGIGELAKGEGMMAVNRGFLYAGAKNVVSTLFKVYDRPSSWLTQYLFEEVLEGMDYSAALRQAKLRLLRMEEVDVKSWCGFVLIGI